MPHILPQNSTGINIIELSKTCAERHLRRFFGAVAGSSELNATASHDIVLVMIDIKKCQENAATTAVLLDAGIALMRQNIRRRHPGQTEAEIGALLSAWLRRADDPIPGDTAGAVCVRTRES